MNSKQSYCLGGRHNGPTVNQNVYEKVNPKTKKLVENFKGKCDICGRKKCQIFTKEMVTTRGESFVKNAKCTQGHRSAMSNSA